MKKPRGAYLLEWCGRRITFVPINSGWELGAWQHWSHGVVMTLRHESSEGKNTDWCVYVHDIRSYFYGKTHQKALDATAEYLLDWFKRSGALLGYDVEE